MEPKEGGNRMVLYGTQRLDHRSQAYDLLARAAEDHWGFTQLPTIQRGPHGKPYFADLEHHTFNLSHTGSIALCVLDEAPVGVDIQIIKEWRPRLPQRVCSAQELAWLEDGPDFWTRFTQLWALKECRAKYDGTGLTRTISEIAVPLPAEQEALCALDGLWFRTYQGDGWRGAVCGCCPPPREIIWLSL